MEQAPAPSSPLSPPPDIQVKIESPAFLEKVRSDAIEGAKECGLRPPFLVDGPERMNDPRDGHGDVLTIKEEAGKQRLGPARFNSDGARTYWSLDGIVTG
jgi:hypothetical protein